MRPIELEMEGFTAYRDRVMVDFREADFFAFVGATGSGKSSVIDAICFVLYGCVPRYDDARLVAPVITQGCEEARVRLDFALGQDRYTAVRVVRRTKAGGATTKEARLERDGTVLAGNADEVTENVVRLTGLSFDHFTKCVVLPQGEFAEFLHAKPRLRQDVLVGLLNLGVYARMGQEANTRAKIAEERIRDAERRLSELAGATPEARGAAEKRVHALAQLGERVAKSEPELASMRQEVAETEAAATTARTWIEALAAITIPKDVPALAAEAETARKAHEQADKLANATGRAVSEARKLSGKLPEAKPLEAALNDHDDVLRLRSELELASKAADVAVDEEQAASVANTNADAEQVEAQAELDALRHAHAAHGLVTTLIVGEPCPVCEHPVDRLPKKRAVTALEKAERRLTGAIRAQKVAQDALTKAAATAAADKRTATTLKRDLAAVEGRATGHPSRQKIEELLDAIAEAEEQLEAALDADEAAKDERAAQQQALEALATRVDGARQQLRAARDTVAQLQPPALAEKDLATDWKTLTDWAKQALREQETQAKKAAKAAAAATKKRDQISGDLAKACADADVEVDRERFAPAVAAAEAHAKSELRQIDANIESAQLAVQQRDEATIENQVAHRLAQHLKSTGFEKWLLEEALHVLAAGATHVLSELSSGQYGLMLNDKGEFLVVDHHNASETRPARTLSGGETFLASLALALALADHLASLAADGAARLEAIFLDEGFGTLDPDTLATVASTIENLGSSGRMVGLITHVPELADRVPVRYEVRKGDRTATVERVVA